MATTPVDNLVLDEAIYPRLSVNHLHIGRLAETLKAGASLPPVIADKASRRVTDGFHRVNAWRQVYKGEGEKEIPVEWRSYANEGELVLDALRLNAKHGRTLTSGDQVRGLALAMNQGIPIDQVASALNITVATLVRRRDLKLEIATSAETNQATTAINPIRTIKPAYSDAYKIQGYLTPEQRRANEVAGGNRAYTWAKWLDDNLRTRGFDPSNERLMDKLVELFGTLSEILE